MEALAAEVLATEPPAPGERAAGDHRLIPEEDVVTTVATAHRRRVDPAGVVLRIELVLRTGDRVVIEADGDSREVPYGFDD